VTKVRHLGAIFPSVSIRSVQGIERHVSRKEDWKMGKRRGQNEGSIHRRKDGRWVASVSIGWKNGQRQRKHFFANSRGEVAEKLKAALRTHQLGLPIAHERQTVQQFLERWLTDVCEPSVRARTLESYKATVKLHIVPELGPIQLTKLSPQHVQGFVKEKCQPRNCRRCRGTGKLVKQDNEPKDCPFCKGSGQRRLSPRSVEYAFSVLSRALNVAVRWDLVPRNVCKSATAPRVPKHEIQPLSPEEARQFLESIKGDRNEALYAIALGLGLRKGEALGLRWEDVALDTGDLKVRYALQRLKGKVELVEPKSERSRRQVALPDFAVRALKAHRVRQKEARLVAGSRWQDTGHVFTTSIGTPMDPRQVSREFRKALIKAGLGQQRFHDLRHTAATLLLVQGVPARVVMEVLGHSQISLTLNTYSHVSPALQREAAGKMDALLDVAN
jgi:integrase